MMLKTILYASLLVILVGCASKPPPRHQDNLCRLFDEEKSWYKKARRSARRWKIEIPVLMAFTHQESSFRSKARPPRKKILWIIPGPRPASAFGFAQATDDTWRMYKRSTGNRGADRDDFQDAMDFIGWYNDLSHRTNGIKKTDTYNLYLAYHEGHGGFKRRTYRNKQWLKNVARKVSARADMYAGQLATCEDKLDRGFLRSILRL